MPRPRSEGGICRTPHLSGLSFSPQSLINGAFKPLSDQGITVTPHLRVLGRRTSHNEQPQRQSYSVALSGTLATLADIHQVEQLAVQSRFELNQKLADINTAHNFPDWVKNQVPFLASSHPVLISTLDTRGLILGDMTTTTQWAISHLGSAGFSDLQTGSSPVGAVCAALNDVFGSPTHKAALAQANSIILSGTVPDVRRMKSLLALADSSHPQVHLSFWSVQASGKKKVVAESMRAMQGDISDTQARVQELHLVLNRALMLSLIANGAARNVFFCRFYGQMFGVQPSEARAELGNLAASVFKNPDLRFYEEHPTQSPILSSLPLPADIPQFHLRDYSNDECLILLGMMQNRDVTPEVTRDVTPEVTREVTQACLRFSLQCNRFENVRQLRAAFQGNNYRPLDPNYYLQLAFDVKRAVRPNQQWDFPAFQGQTRPKTEASRGLSHRAEALRPKEWVQLSPERTGQLQLNLPDSAIAQSLEGASDYLALGIETELQRFAREHMKDGKIVPGGAVTPESASAFQIGFEALQSENKQTLFPALCSTFTPDFSLQGQSDCELFLTSLHDYYDLERALGLNATLQGRYLRRRGQENAEFGAGFHRTQAGLQPRPTPRANALQMNDCNSHSRITNRSYAVERDRA